MNQIKKLRNNKTGLRHSLQRSKIRIGCQCIKWQEAKKIKGQRADHSTIHIAHIKQMKRCCKPLVKAFGSGKENYGCFLVSPMTLILIKVILFQRTQRE